MRIESDISVPDIEDLLIRAISDEHALRQDRIVLDLLEKFPKAAQIGEYLNLYKKRLLVLIAE